MVKYNISFLVPLLTHLMWPQQVPSGSWASGSPSITRGSSYHRHTFRGCWRVNEICGECFDCRVNDPVQIKHDYRSDSSLIHLNKWAFPLLTLFLLKFQNWLSGLNMHEGSSSVCSQIPNNLFSSSLYPMCLLNKCSFPRDLKGCRRSIQRSGYIHLASSSQGFI